MPSESATGLLEHPHSGFPELLHALAQPLTSLRCSLETTLLCRRDSDEYRASLRDSLQLAEEISAWASGLRELVSIETAPRFSEPYRFDEVLQEVVAQRRAIALGRGSDLRDSCETGLTCNGDRDQITKALTYVIDYALEVVPPGPFEIMTSREGERIRVTFTSTPSAWGPDFFSVCIGKPPLRPYIGFLIARGIFTLAGGSLEQCLDAGGWRVEASLSTGRG